MIIKKASALLLCGMILFCSAECTQVNAEGEKITLKVTSWRTEDIAFWEEINTRFTEEYPNIEVVYNPVKNTEYDGYLMTALKGGTAEDIIHSRNDENGALLYDAGYLEPLNEEMLPNLKNHPQTYRDHFIGADGEYFGIPADYCCHGVIYNKELFDEYGLEEPTTWDEFKEVCQILKENGVIPLASGIKEEWTLSNMWTASFYANFCGEEWRENLLAGKDDFLNEGFVEHLQLIKDLEEFLPENYTGLSYADTQQLFLSGQAAIFFAGSWDYPFFSTTNPELDMGIFSVPVKEEGDIPQVTWSPSVGYSINKSSPNKEAAATYINWLLSNEVNEYTVNLMPGFFSTNPNVTEYEDPISQEWHSWIEEDGSNLAYMWNYSGVGLNGMQPEAYGLSGTAIAKMWTEDWSAEQAAQFIQDGVLEWYEPLQNYVASKE